MVVLVALGGNALAAPDGSTHPSRQQAAAVEAARKVARVVASGHRVVITHGNGPQVGNVLLKQEMAAAALAPVPLDWCGAMTQGSLGFLLVNALANEAAASGVDRPVTAVITRTLVDPQDPAFDHPTKPIGRFLPPWLARDKVERGETWVASGARGWRRVVPSPEPVEVLDAGVIRALIAAGYLVICNGGGGIPVVRDEQGMLRGVEAVVDKDLGAVLLGREIGADVLVIATDVEHAMVGWGTVDERPIEAIAVSDLRVLAQQGEFGSGSMGPKVEAACRFVESGGRLAVITSIDCIPEALAGAAGTRVQPG
jgi:carbamate kinase